MDNLTHSLTGLALSRAGLNRFSPHATALLLLSANAPDIDILAASRGEFAYIEAHRGYTHCFLFLPVLAALPVLVIAGVSRRRLPWLKAWLLCCVGLTSHLMMDWTNSFGVRLLLPFSSRWFHLDLNSLYDGWILAVLAVAAVWPLFARLVSNEIGARPAAGRGIAVFALAFSVLFDCGRAALHARAVAQLDSRLYDNAPPVQAAALPEPFSPFQWTGIAESPGAYRALELDVFGQPDFENAHTWYKLAMTATLENAKATEPFRYFLYFARFPVWSVNPVIRGNGMQGHRVELTDLRFGSPGAGSFHCIAFENSQGQVLESLFTFRSGRDLGWGAGHGFQRPN
jgi:inner membrane protein